MRHPYLGRAQYVSSGMQAERDCAEAPLLTVGQASEVMLTQPVSQNRQAQLLRKIALMTRAGMVGMRVRDYRSGHRPPRVDVKVAGRAVEPFIGGNNQGVTHAAPHSLVRVQFSRNKLWDNRIVLLLHPMLSRHRRHG